MNFETKQIEAIFDDGKKGTIDIKVPVREKKRCYIVGCADSKDIVPWGDENAEYWGVNNLYGVPLKGAKWDRWFEIHNLWFDKDLNCFLRRGLRDFRGTPVVDYMKGLSTLGVPVYMQKYWIELVPNSIPFPLKEMIDFFANEKGLGLTIARYLTNTISIEIAFAIYQGFEEIHVYGVDMAVGSEYQHQRPSCEYWLGVASGLGIKVYIPDEADLLKTRFIYGFEESTQNQFERKVKKIKTNMINKRNAVANQIEHEKRSLEQYTGAIHAIDEIDKIWSNCADDLVVR